jgi:mono/diheme cytochrome c family protein
MRVNSASVVITLCLVAVPLLAADKTFSIDVSKLPPAAQKAKVSYATDIKPILDASCVKCHGQEKPKARLRLDSLEGAQKGGESGQAIKPGNSAASPLVHSIAQLADPDYHMPPPGNKAGIKPLTKDEIGLIRAWIDQGAK